MHDRNKDREKWQEFGHVSYPYQKQSEQYLFHLFLENPRAINQQNLFSDHFRICDIARLLQFGWIHHLPGLRKCKRQSTTLRSVSSVSWMAARWKIYHTLSNVRNFTRTLENVSHIHACWEALIHVLSCFMGFPAYPTNFNIHRILEFLGRSKTVRAEENKSTKALKKFAQTRNKQI